MKEKFYGYVRVSTREQHTDRQMIALLASGVRKEDIFVDIQSGKDFLSSCLWQADGGIGAWQYGGDKKP